MSLGLVLWLCGSALLARPPVTKKKQLQKARKALLRRISQIQKILTQTATRQKTNIGCLEAINQQVDANESLIQTIQQEAHIISRDIAHKQQAIIALNHEHKQLQSEYATMVYIGAKAMHSMHTLVFVFSSASFNELVQRIRYVRHYTRLREKHLREIQKVVVSLQQQQCALQQRQQAKKALLRAQQLERAKLKQLRQKHAKLLKELKKQHSKLRRELLQRSQGLKRLDKLTQDTIQKAEASEKITSARPKKVDAAPPATPHTPASPTAPRSKSNQSVSPKKKPGRTTPKKELSKQSRRTNTKFTQLTKAFRQQKGKLPWPVKEGLISSKFGVSKHPVLRQVEVENLGVDILTKASATVHAIFDGVVKAIAFVPGMQCVVIIQHGHYHSVYARLKRTRVTVGQRVKARTPIGIVSTDARGSTELQLQIWHHSSKLNPARWITRRP